MSSQNNEQKQKQEEKTELEISAKKYSTIVDFQEDFDKEKEKEINKKKSEEELKRQEEEAKEKEEEENLKQQILNHWSKLLLKEPPKRRTCHTSFLSGSTFYVVGGIDITEQKQDDIYKVDLSNPKEGWVKIDVLGEKMGRIAYHAGAELNGFYYIVGGQDEYLNTLNSILIYDITQERLSEKIENLELEVSLQVTDVQKLELLKKFLQILRVKVKDKTESDIIKVLETELEQNLLKYLEEDELIKREKKLLEEMEQNLQTVDINKLMDSSTDIKKMAPEELEQNFSQDLIHYSLESMGKLVKIYMPPLESHTVNVSDNKLYIYGGMSGKDYNSHIFTFDPQTKKAQNLTENIEKNKLPPPRQDHAAVIYGGSLYVYGGIGPDSKIYDDMWKYDLSSNSWEEIKTEQQRIKEEKRRQKLEEKKAKNEEIDSEEEDDDFDDEEDEENKDIRPKGRSGHSMVLVGDCFYIFGGKTGLIKESNEIWIFNPTSKTYECVHETLLEQFTKEELQKISSENKNDSKKFRWLTRSDIEKRTNPSFNDNKTEAEIEKEKKKRKKLKENKENRNENNKNISPEKAKDQKKKIEKSKKKPKIEKNDNKANNKDIEGKYSEQVLCRPNVVKMRKTLIFTSDPEKIKEGLNTLSKDEKEKVNSNIQKIKGELPEPRDGQSVCVKDNDLYIFGGDRFKFPFNDLFILDTLEIPRMKVKESSIKKREREREKEEKRLKEEKEKEEQKQREEKEKEEREKLEKKLKENDEKEVKGDEEEDNEGNQEDNNKVEDEKQKAEEEKDDTNGKKGDGLILLRDMLQY